MIEIALTQPFFLWGVLLIIPITLARYWTLSEWPHWQLNLALVVRVLTVLLFFLAFAGPLLIIPNHEKMVLFLVDRSSSLDEAARKKADDFLQECFRFSGKTTCRVIEFAGVPRIIFDDSALLQPDETNIALALEQAATLFPPDKLPMFLLLSDGNETRGNVLARAEQLMIPLSTVMLPNPVLPEVLLARIDVPTTIREGEPFYVDVVVWSNVETDALITVYRNNQKVFEETNTLLMGENRFRAEQKRATSHREFITAKVKAIDDTRSDNNTNSNIIVAKGKTKVLFLSSNVQHESAFCQLLQKQEMEVKTQRPEELPLSLDELSLFDIVILSNISSVELNHPQMELLQHYVHERGGGLLVIGGDQSFGAGGYHQSPLEEILPVFCDYHQEKEKPSIALCLAIDRSGSMGGEKIELAKEAVKRTVELLSPQDHLAIIAFDQQPFVVVPMQTADILPLALVQVEQLTAGAGTQLYPVLVEAIQQLEHINAPLKHVILLTDGYSEQADFEGIISQMTARNITISVIAIGQADSLLLEQMAQWGKGRFWNCPDSQSIPRILAQEAMQASQSAIREELCIPQLVSSDKWVQDIDFQSVPPLLGYVKTRIKPMSYCILATEWGEPLLTHWRYGLGHCTAFTSDIQENNWSSEWFSWPEFALFWGGIVRQTIRKNEEAHSQWKIARQGNDLMVTLDVLDENEQFINGAKGSISVIRQGESPIDILLQATAPGRYECRIPAVPNSKKSIKTEGNEPNQQMERNEETSLQITLQKGGEIILSQAKGVPLCYPDELLIRPPNERLLRILAERTGGLFNPTPVDLFAKSSPLPSEKQKPSEKRGTNKTIPLWPWLLGAALCLYLPDLFLRRVKLGRRK